jgi:cytidylate kinase
MRDARRNPIRLLTISREYGAGGSDLGVVLGEKLGWPVIDHELVRRLAAAATVTAPESRVHSSPWTTDPDCVAAAAREVLLEAAKNPPAIMVGHGGNCLFRGRPDVLRVRVVAPFEVRVQRVAGRTGAPPQRVAADVRRRDADRQHYLQRYYKTDMNEPCSYDLQINTGTVSLESAAELVLELIATDAASL